MGLFAAPSWPRWRWFRFSLFFLRLFFLRLDCYCSLVSQGLLLPFLRLKDHGSFLLFSLHFLVGRQTSIFQLIGSPEISSLHSQDFFDFSPWDPFIFFGVLLLSSRFDPMDATSMLLP